MEATATFYHSHKTFTALHKTSEKSDSDNDNDDGDDDKKEYLTFAFNGHTE